MARLPDYITLVGSSTQWAGQGRVSTDGSTYIIDMKPVAAVLHLDIDLSQLPPR